jgi:hypothetical protein
MAHDDKKFTKGMTTAQKKKFESEDEKNDSKLAAKVKGKKACSCGKCKDCKAKKAKKK